MGFGLGALPAAARAERVRQALVGFGLEELAPGAAVFACVRAEDVSLGPRGEPAGSARNHPRGRILQVLREGPLARIELDCGFPLVARITRASADELGLAEGQEVEASVKATNVRLLPRG